MAQSKQDRVARDVAATVSVAAQFMADHPEMISNTLRLHRLGLGGECTGCMTRVVTWPCATASIAQAALELVQIRKVAG